MMVLFVILGVVFCLIALAVWTGQKMAVSLRRYEPPSMESMNPLHSAGWCAPTESVYRNPFDVGQAYALGTSPYLSGGDIDDLLDEREPMVSDHMFDPKWGQDCQHMYEGGSDFMDDTVCGLPEENHVFVTRTEDE